MIQDIGQAIYHNEYRPRAARAGDVICIFSADRVLADTTGDRLRLPTRADWPGAERELQYLFSIDDTAWYLAPDGALPGFGPVSVRTFRTLGPRDTAFGMITAWQLFNWYRDNRRCGRCGSLMGHSLRERALICPDCGSTVYPRLNPAVIVAVRDGDDLLLTQYAGRGYTNYALIAGFCEVGETVEETVHREVLEEVGLEVTDLRYYKSQPWSLTSTLLMGFWARLKGSRDIRLDEDELAKAVWMPRSQVAELEDDGISLTREMIARFAAGED